MKEIKPGLYCSEQFLALRGLGADLGGTTFKIGEMQGIKQAGFWTTVIGESNQTLYYFVVWESLAEREKKWNAFGADPEWHKARAETEKNGAIVANVKNFILAPTAFSAVK